MFSLAHMILDGANGTELQRRGMPAGCCGEQWILAHPEAELDVQRRYVEAGSTAILAPTFGANRISLAHHGLGDCVRDYNLRLVALSRQAADGRALVGGDLSPTGLCCGSVEPALFDRVKAAFREQAQALEEAGVDFFMVETQISLAEARATVLAIREVSDKPIFVSFTMTPSGKTLSGGEIASALLTLEPLGIAAFGVNCVDNAARIAATLTELRSLTNLPLLVQANAGLPETVDGKSVYSASPAQMAADARRYYDCGADIFGSCCGSNAQHIRAIAETVSPLPLRTHEGEKPRCLCSEYRYLPMGQERREATLTHWENWEDELERFEEEGAELLHLHVETREQLDAVLSQQGAFRMPLCVRFSDISLKNTFFDYYIGLADSQND